MKKAFKKGMTLVEVIIAITILSTVIIGMLGIFAGGFQNVFNLRKRNVENATIQGYFEDKMSELRKKGITDSTNSFDFVYTANHFSGGTIQVQGKEYFYEEDPSRKISLFASKRKEAVLEIPEDVKITFPDDSNRRFYYVGEKIPEPKVEITYAGLKGNQKIERRDNWLQSYRAVGDAGVVTVGSLVAEDQKEAPEKIVPNMSNTTRDVKAITTHVNSITVSDDMRAKFITPGVRLINTYGRVGSYHTGPRLWILGLPITNDLVAHSDADLATLPGGGPIVPSATPEPGAKVLNLADIDPDNPKPTIGSGVPVLAVKDPDVNQVLQFFALENKLLQLSSLDLSKGSTTTVFLKNEDQSGEIINYKFSPNLTWRLVINPDDTLTAYAEDTAGINSRSGSETINRKLDFSAANVVSVTSTVNNGRSMTVAIYVNNDQVFKHDVSLSSPNAFHDMTNATVSFGGKTFINEFAVYNRPLGNELSTVVSYFGNKYDKKYND